MKATLFISAIALTAVLIHSAQLNDEEINGQNFAVEVMDENSYAEEGGNDALSRQKRSTSKHGRHRHIKRSANNAGPESPANNAGPESPANNARVEIPANEDAAHEVVVRAFGRRNFKKKMSEQIL